MQLKGIYTSPVIAKKKVFFFTHTREDEGLLDSCVEFESNGALIAGWSNWISTVFKQQQHQLYYQGN